MNMRKMKVRFLSSPQWEISIAVKCHSLKVYVMGSNPIFPTILCLTLKIKIMFKNKEEVVQFYDRIEQYCIVAHGGKPDKIEIFADGENICYLFTISLW
jgi:hypothetical protein